MKHIRRTRMTVAVLLALLLSLAALGMAFSVAAEGEDPVGNETSDTQTTSDPNQDDTSAPGDETSDETGDTSDNTSDTDPNAYTVTFNVNGDGDSAVCYFGGSDTPATQFVGTEPTLEVRIVAAPRYKLLSVVSGGGGEWQITGENECSFTLNHLSANEFIRITASTEIKPEPVSLQIDSFGTDGVKVTYEGQTVDYSAPLSVTAGETVTVDFDIGDADFDPAKAVFKVNGASQELAGPSFTFVIRDNTTLLFTYDMVRVTFKLVGPSTVTVQGHSTFRNGTTGEDTHPIEYRAGATMRFTVNPLLNYEIESVTSGGASVSAQGGLYSILIGGDTNIVITAKFNGTTPPVDDRFSIRINVAAGGRAAVGTQTIAGGNGTLIKAAEGDELEIAVTPDTGYEVDYFRVGGETKTLTDNRYTLKVTGDATVSVTFKSINTEPVTKGIAVKDVDWSAEPVVIDVTSETTVLREVFDHIASMNRGKAVEFRGLNGTVIVPSGVEFAGSAASANMAISRVTTGEVYNTVGGLLGAGTANPTQFAIYSFAFGTGMPEGTSVTLKPGAQLAGQQVALRLFDSANIELYSKENAAEVYKVDAAGVTEALPYDNEGTLVLVKDAGEVPQVKLTSGEGGDIIASPYNNLRQIGDEFTFYVNSQNGYTIKSLVIDGVEIGDAAGKLTFNYTLKVTGQEHEVTAEFEKTVEEGPGGSGKVIAILAIVLVALAGAAALFIVKWRQEKY